MKGNLFGETMTGTISGEQRLVGSAIPRGNDGISPTIEIEKIEGGTRVIITDIKGKKHFDVLNGVSSEQVLELIRDYLEQNASAFDEKILDVVQKYFEDNPIEFHNFVKTVNGIAPDETGNVNVDVQAGTESLIVTILWNDIQNNGTASHSPAEVYAAINNGTPVSVNWFNTDQSQFYGQPSITEATQSYYHLSLLADNLAESLVVRSNNSVIKEHHYLLFSPTYGAENGQILAVKSLDDNGNIKSLKAVDMPTTITPVRGVDYWTPEDIAEIKSYVDEAILGGAW